MKTVKLTPVNATAITMFLLSFSLILFELLLTRLFGIVIFAQFAQMVLALALLGISIGSVFQHIWPNLLPEENFEKQLAKISILLGISLVIAIIATVMFPVTDQFEVPPLVYQERSYIRGKLINMFWLSTLMPFLLIPFIFAGIIFSGVFFRKKRHIGLLYGADLIGGAAGAIAFIPLLSNLAGPDVIWVALAASLISAAVLFYISGYKRWFIGTTAATLITIIIILTGLTGFEFLKIRYAAGYSEKNITYSLWTPLTRLAVHEDKRGKYIVLDNSSASEILRTEADRVRKIHEINRSFVYQMYTPPAKIAILASSAGPEVSIAQYYGFDHIDAVDIAGEIADVVRDRFPDAPINPFIIGNTNQIKADGRAAILYSKHPYDIIQMVHANLHSNAGLLANAWSPALLETEEAFSTYFDHLSKNGTISFGRGSFTPHLAKSAASALRDRGIKDPWKYIAYVKGNAQFILVKKHPWTPEELDKLRLVAQKNHCTFTWYPGWAPNKKAIDLFYDSTLLTDDKPYLDTFDMLKNAMANLLERDDKTQKSPMDTLYGTIAVQIIFVLAAGILFMFIPLIRRGTKGINKINRSWVVLAYVSCLGYGYLAVETVLIHELILFVGHPTYAVTVVILAMLLFSGIGAVVSGRIKESRLDTVLKTVLFTLVILASLQAGVFPKLLTTYGLGLPMPTRLFITFALLAPLGFVMGIPFPLAMRIIPSSAGGLIPWAWALNGWMSVVATLLSVILARINGYSYAFYVAIIFYMVALALSFQLRGVGREIKYTEQKLE